MLDWLKIGIVDDLQARASAIAAANPRHAARILGRGRGVEKPAILTAPIVLARGVSKAGRPRVMVKKPPKPRERKVDSVRHPWRKLEIGEWFDVAIGSVTRVAMAKQARQARKRCDARFGVTIAVDDAGESVVRVTRVA